MFLIRRIIMYLNKYFVLKRLEENALITIITSMSIFVLIKIGVLKGSVGAYNVIFGTSMILNFILTYISHSMHFNALENDVKSYLVVNLLLFAAGVAINMIAIVCFNPSLYTAFFGYTKVFRSLINATPIKSSLIFWGINLLTLLAVIPVGLFRNGYDEQTDDSQE